MSIPNDRPLQRRPVHPGEILREDFMPDYDLSVSGLAAALGVSRQSVNELIRERRGRVEMRCSGESGDAFVRLTRSGSTSEAP